MIETTGPLFLDRGKEVLERKLMQTKNKDFFDSVRELKVDGVSFRKDENNVLYPLENVPEKHLFAKIKTSYLPILSFNERFFSEEELNSCSNPYNFQLFSYVCSFLLFGERVDVEYENKPVNVMYQKNRH
jgi:hypothetical protein